ncbi:MAG: 1,4-alpha-glucan branching protein GlgB, partial [Nostocoides sp.]
IRGSDDILRAKSDPMARRTEIPPATASVVDHSTHEWGDDAWMTARRETNPHGRPMSTYEVHLGSWRQGMSYRDLAEHLVNYVADLGFTHVELLPVMEHPYGPSWGYQVTGYYAPTSRFGTPDDFKYLVDALHQAGIGVILDWVPAHFPKDAWALARFDGLPLYEHPDPRRGDQPDWGTHIFDFGRIQVRNFLVANATYWLEEFHIDGLRVDAVASMLYLDYSRKAGEWLPNVHGGRENLEAIGLLQEANATAYKRSPGIVTIAEESTSWPGVTKETSSGGLGFGLKWNMGWMNDSLRYLQEDPVNRQYHHNLLTFSLMYAYSENYLLPISHDEVVHGKRSLLNKIPGSRFDQLATLRTYLAYMWSHPGKQLLFMGQEFAQPGEWADGRSLDWWLLDHAAHYRVHNLVKELNRIYTSHDAMWALDSSPSGFEWLDANDNAGNTFSYLRFGDADHSSGSAVAVAANFSGAAKEGLRLGVPRGGRWQVVMDTSGYDEHGTPSQAGLVLEAVEGAWQGQPFSVQVRVARLSAVYLAPADDA